MLVREIETRFKQIIMQVCQNHQAEIEELEVLPDHVQRHGKSRAAIGRSSRFLRQEFAVLKRNLPTLWTNSSFVGTTGGEGKWSWRSSENMPPAALYIPRVAQRDCCEETSVLKAQQKRLPASNTRLAYALLRETLQEEERMLSQRSFDGRDVVAPLADAGTPTKSLSSSEEGQSTNSTSSHSNQIGCLMCVPSSSTR
jgi:hypothetical protein